MFSVGDYVKVMQFSPLSDRRLYAAIVIRVTKTRVVVRNPYNKLEHAFLLSTSYEVGAKSEKGIGRSFVPRIEPMPHDDAIESCSGKHLCCRCMRHRDEHGGFNNPHRPYACPGTLWPTYPPDSAPNVVHREYREAVDVFWNERTTTFKPVT